MRLASILKRQGAVGVLSALLALPFGSPAFAAGPVPLSDCGYGTTQYYNNLQSPDGTVYNEFVTIDYNYNCTSVSFPTAGIQIVSVPQGHHFGLATTTVYGPTETLWISAATTPRLQYDQALSSYPCFGNIATAPNWTYLSLHGYNLSRANYSLNTMLCFYASPSTNTFDSIRTITP